MMRKISRVNLSVSAIIIAFLILLMLSFDGFKPTLHKQESTKDMLTIDMAVLDDLTFTLISQTGDTRYAELLTISRQDDHGEWQRIYESDFLNLKPWKLSIADVDGDGIQDIIIAVHKTTHFDDEAKNRLFIFNFDGEKLYKKWTGSQIAGVWSDFFVGDLLPMPGEQFIFIEQVADEGERLHIYYWFNFGFISFATSEIYDDIIDFAIIGDNHMQLTSKTEHHEETLMLIVKDGGIIEWLPEG